MMKKTKVIHVRLKERCAVCEKLKTEGIKVFHSFLCEQCEQEMLETDTEDAKYQYYLEKMKNLLPSTGESS